MLLGFVEIEEKSVNINIKINKKHNPRSEVWNKIQFI